MLAHRPAFTVHPGESGATAVRRLLALAPDLLHFRGPIARLRLPSPTDAADYAFGSYHPVHHARLSLDGPGRHARPGLRRTRASARPSTGAPSPSSASACSRSTTSTAPLVADAGSHAADILARAQRDAQSGEILAPPSCTLELHDVVDVHTPSGGAATTMRVAALELDCRRTGTPKYQQKITLTGL